MLDEFQIGELAEKTGVTLRTIRYYTSEGLLPDPIKRGSRYYYTQEHIDRLKEIEILKRRFLPLQEIRQILNNASAEDIQKLLKYQDALTEKNPVVASHLSNNSAMDHLEDLLSRQPEWDPNRGSIPTRGHRKSPPIIMSRVVFHNEMESEAWVRITLTHGIELHYLENLDPDIRNKLEDLLKFSKNVFNK